MFFSSSMFLPFVYLLYLVLWAVYWSILFFCFGTCSELNFVPQKRCVQVLTPIPMNMTQFKNRVFSDVSSQEAPGEIILDLRWALNPITSIFMKERRPFGHGHTKRYRKKNVSWRQRWKLKWCSCKWRDAKDHQKPWETKKRQRGHSLETSEWGWSATHWLQDYRVMRE